MVKPESIGIWGGITVSVGARQFSGSHVHSLSRMHAVVAIHRLIRGSSAEHHGSDVVSERTSGQLHMTRPNSFTPPPPRIGHTKSLAA